MLQKNKSDVFFSQSKKNKLKILAFFFVSLMFVVIALTDIKWSNFFQQILNNKNKPRFLFTVLFSFCIFWINDIWIRILCFKIISGQYLKNTKWSEWIGLAMICYLIQTLTPFSIGSEAFIIWWLIKKGLPTQKAYIAVSISIFCWFVSQILITWPSFIYFTKKEWLLIKYNPIYWLSLCGLIFDLLIWMIIFAINYSKNIHYFFLKTLNNIKKIMYLDHIEDSQIAYEYFYNNSYKREYLDEIKSSKTLKLIILFLIQNFLFYILYSFISELNDIRGLLNNFNIINIATTANNFLPIPSAEGTLQITIKNLFNNNQNINPTILIWRFFTKYMGLMISIIYCFFFNFKSNNKNNITKQEYRLWNNY